MPKIQRARRAYVCAHCGKVIRRREGYRRTSACRYHLECGDGRKYLELDRCVGKLRAGPAYDEDMPEILGRHLARLRRAGIPLGKLGHSMRLSYAGKSWSKRVVVYYLEKDEEKARKMLESRVNALDLLMR